MIPLRPSRSALVLGSLALCLLPGTGPALSRAAPPSDPAVALVAAGTPVAPADSARRAYRRWRKRRIALRRIVERPNSFYSSILVKNQEDRTRWGRIDLSRVHPVNREEVQRLLARADALGVDTLSARERVFLESLTDLSFGARPGGRIRSGACNRGRDCRAFRC